MAKRAFLLLPSNDLFHRGHPMKFMASQLHKRGGIRERGLIPLVYKAAIPGAGGAQPIPGREIRFGG